MAAEIVDAVKALATAEKKSCVQCGNEYSGTSQTRQKF